MLKIRDFAKLAEVSMTTLRYYDEIYESSRIFQLGVLLLEQLVP